MLLQFGEILWEVPGILYVVSGKMHLTGVIDVGYAGVSITSRDCLTFRMMYEILDLDSITNFQIFDIYIVFFYRISLPGFLKLFQDGGFFYSNSLQLLGQMVDVQGLY